MGQVLLRRRRIVSESIGQQSERARNVSVACWTSLSQLSFQDPIHLGIWVFDTLSDSIQCLNFAKKWFIQYSIQYSFTQDSIYFKNFFYPLSLIQFNVWILPKNYSFNILFNIAFANIQFKILFNSKYYSIQNKLWQFNSKDYSIQ